MLCLHGALSYSNLHLVIALPVVYICLVTLQDCSLGCWLINFIGKLQHVQAEAISSCSKVGLAQVIHYLLKR